jgi:hypothetical protein
VKDEKIVLDILSCKCNVDSVMIDGSSLSLAENTRWTAKMVRTFVSFNHPSWNFPLNYVYYRMSSAHTDVVDIMTNRLNTHMKLELLSKRSWVD